MSIAVRSGLVATDMAEAESGAQAADHGSIFSALYRDGHWGAGRNPGSTLESTRSYRAFIEQFVVEHAIRSALDAGCGDAAFPHAIDWKGARYVGLDIVPSVIEDNRRAHPAIEFVEGDARCLGRHGGYDLLLLKDVLQHWSNEAVLTFLAQPALASFRHVLFTNCDDEGTDAADIRDGDWRPINLAAPPFASFGARPITRLGSKRILHRGPRARGSELLERFEWWIVNLERRPDRLAHARAQLARIGVASPRRFQAFDGVRLQLTSIRRDWVRKGAVGCYLSHLALLKQAQARRMPCVIVEDDLELVPDFAERFGAFVAAVPDDWDVLLLSAGAHCREPHVLGPEHVRLVATWGTTMAFLRLPAIDRMLEEADTLDRPIDDFYIRMMATMKFYAPARPLVTQGRHLGTNIGDAG